MTSNIGWNCFHHGNSNLQKFMYLQRGKRKGSLNELEPSIIKINSSILDFYQEISMVSGSWDSFKILYNSWWLIVLLCETSYTKSFNTLESVWGSYTVSIKEKEIPEIFLSTESAWFPNNVNVLYDIHPLKYFWKTFSGNNIFSH